MAYRRPHHRRAHIRRNSDGSKSYVRESYVKGHNYESHQYSYSDDNNTNIIDNFLSIFVIGSFISLISDLLSCSDGILFSLVIFLVSIIITFIYYSTEQSNK